MKVFRVEGLYSPKGKNWFKFTKEVVAADEKQAEEKAYSLMGSKYGIKRRLVNIKAINEISVEAARDTIVQYLMRDTNE